MEGGDKWKPVLLVVSRLLRTHTDILLSVGVYVCEVSAVCGINWLAQPLWIGNNAHWRLGFIEILGFITIHCCSHVDAPLRMNTLLWLTVRIVTFIICIRWFSRISCFNSIRGMLAPRYIILWLVSRVFVLKNYDLWQY